MMIGHGQITGIRSGQSEVPRLVTELPVRQTMEFRYLMIDQFSQHMRYRGFTESTLRRRRETIRQFARFVHPLGLEAVGEQHVEDFLGTKKAARTKHAYRSDLRVFYTWALKHELVPTNPTAELDPVKVPKSLPRPIDHEAAKSTLQVGSLRTRQMVGLALFAGFRCHEIAALQAEDVWTHVIPSTITVRNGKGGKDRTVELHPTLAELLSGLPSSGAVFPGRGIPTIRPGSVSRAITAHLQACGIAGTPHQLRHTFGTGFARASGGDMNATAEAMGHESMGTTMGYVRLSQSRSTGIIGRLYGDDAA